jgi:HlyD family secretion protein
MKLRWLFLILLIATVAAAYYHFNRPQPVRVALHEVERGEVRATVSNTRVGTVKACRRAYLAPAIGGQVAALWVTEGDAVEKDVVLLEIWNEDLRAQVDLALRETDAARARAKEACAQAEGAKREAARLKSLEEKNMVSEEDVDLALTKADALHAGCQAARAQTQVSIARTRVATTNLERTIVRSPFPGVVAEVNAELGGYVTPSPPGIQTLPAIRTGLSACISLDAFPDKRCNATVRRIAPYVLDLEKQARTVEVEVEVTDPQDLATLLPGYSADIEITLETRSETLRIPTEALLPDNRVLVFNDETQLLEERQIETGLANWDYTEVISGLEAGERIVTSVSRDGVEAGVLAAPEDSAGS